MLIWRKQYLCNDAFPYNSPEYIDTGNHDHRRQGKQFREVFSWILMRGGIGRQEWFHIVKIIFTDDMYIVFEKTQIERIGNDYTMTVYTNEYELPTQGPNDTYYELSDDVSFTLLPEIRNSCIIGRRFEWIKADFMICDLRHKNPKRHRIILKGEYFGINREIDLLRRPATGISDNQDLDDSTAESD